MESLKHLSEILAEKVPLLPRLRGQFQVMFGQAF
jgi:hypothetical protein